MLKISVTASGLIPPAEPGITAAILEEFRDEAGPLIIKAIRAVLGTSEMGYPLSPEYAKAKPKLPRFQRVANKTSEQPGILTGDHIYDALIYTMEGSTLTVTVDQEKALTESGFDVAHYIDIRSAFTEKASEHILPVLGPILARICLKHLFLTP